MPGAPIFAIDADAELEEKLKAVMILFDKSHQGLNEEIESLELQLSYLEEQNAKLERDLGSARRDNLDLKTQLLVQESQRQVAGAASDVIAAELVASNSNFGNTDQSACQSSRRPPGSSSSATGSWDRRPDRYQFRFQGRITPASPGKRISG